jgi:hypothetical protein
MSPARVPGPAHGAWVVLATLLWAGAAACRPGSEAFTPQLELLEEGEWQLAAQRRGEALLVRTPARRDGARPGGGGVRPGAGQAGAPTAPAHEQLLLRDGRVAATGPVGERALRLPAAPYEPAPDPNLRVGHATLGGEPVLFTLPAAGPALLPAPGDPDRYLFEAAGTLWLLELEGQPRRAVADRVAGGEAAVAYDRERLAALQREGAVILYWAAAPVWRPDGRAVAYATNREAVAEARGGQAVWLAELDAAAPRERPLLAAVGAYFVPFAWLGGALVYHGSEPGVWTVDPATGARRRLAPGLAVAGTADGAALLVADSLPDATALRVFRAPTGAGTPVPPAPAGFTYQPEGSFSPGGRLLLLQAGAELGHRRRFLVHDVERGGLHRLPLPARALPVHPPRWLDDATLLFVLAEPGPGGVRSWLVRLR